MTCRAMDLPRASPGLPSRVVVLLDWRNLEIVGCRLLLLQKMKQGWMDYPGLHHGMRPLVFRRDTLLWRIRI
jgi:hypothetical protein